MATAIVTNNPLKKGDKVKCARCGKKHVVECGTEKGVETNTLMYVKCRGKTYIVGMDGYQIVFPNT